VCCRDGVILGADTKSTAGTGIADSGTAKLRRIFPRRISAASEARLNCASTRKFELDQSRVYIGCGGAGVSADCEQACARLSAIIEALLFDASLNSSPNRSRLPLNLMTIASRTMTEIIHAPREGQVSCSMLLGGCGESQAIPASLYRISSIEGEAAVQLPFGSVGSGAADALAALETAGLGKLVESQPSSIGTFSTFCNISVAEAVSIVRSAVRAGISNDLGSGFHVDLLAMTPFGWRMWREECCRKEESRIKGQSRINGLQRMHRKELSSRVGPEHGWYVAWNATAEGLSSSRHGAIDELQRAKIRQVVPVIDAQCE
jgi:20S proteasome subunit beta 2